MQKFMINRRSFISAAFGMAGSHMLPLPAMSGLSDWRDPNGFTLQLWNVHYVDALKELVDGVGSDELGALDELGAEVEGKLSLDGGIYPIETRRVVTDIWAWNLNGLEEDVLGYDQMVGSGEPQERRVPTIIDTRAAGAPALPIRGPNKGYHLPMAGWRVATEGDQALASLIFDSRYFNWEEDYRFGTYFLICQHAGPATVAPHGNSVGVHILPKNLAETRFGDRKHNVPRVFG